MKTPLDAAYELVACFRWDLEGAMQGNFDERKVYQGKPIPPDVLIPVVIALRSYLHRESKSLEEAFGGSPGRASQLSSKKRERERIRWLVKDLADEYRASPEIKLQGVSPKDYGISETARLLGKTESNVRDIYDGER